MPEDRAPTDMPLPAAVRTKRFTEDDWLLAETEVGRLFAEAAAQLARYDERLRRLPGCDERIALLSASAAAQPLPIPVPPPVTSAFFPCKVLSVMRNHNLFLSVDVRAMHGNSI